MNDPSAQPIDIGDQRNWIIDHRKATGASWAEIAKRTGIPQGTLSQFGSDRGYAGNEQAVADKVFKYRQLLATQAQITVEAPEVPGYFDTETSSALISLLTWGQRGRIVVAAMGPGTGKTSTARHFAACFPNVFLATMSPSTAAMNNMQVEVLDALGEKDAMGGSQKLTQRIVQRVRNLANPLIILDEAQHLSEKSIEEARSWHDKTGVGVALLGNIGVMQRIEGGSRKAHFAQLYSRIGMRMVRPVPLQGDCDRLAAAWNVHGEKEVGFIRKIGQLPGGLRGATMMLELGSMIAVSEGQPLAVDHLQDAWAQLSSRAIAA